MMIPQQYKTTVSFTLYCAFVWNTVPKELAAAECPDCPGLSSAGMQTQTHTPAKQELEPSVYSLVLC